MRWARYLLVGAFLVAVACGPPGRGDGRLRVVASFYPLAFVASSIGGSDVVVTNLTPSGAEPHDLELTPGDVREIHDADLVVYLSGGFQPAVENAVASARGSLDVLHQATSGDPHIWLDPELMIGVTRAVEHKLSSLDRDRSTAYRARSDGLVRDLRRTDGSFKSTLSSCTRDEVVTSHDAFGYLTARYGLHQVPIAGIDPETEPTPRRSAGVVREILAQGATTIFVEPFTSPKLAQTIAREAGVATAVLDPLENIKAGSGDDYFTVMHRNLSALGRALGCK